MNTMNNNYCNSAKRIVPDKWVKKIFWLLISQYLAPKHFSKHFGHAHWAGNTTYLNCVLVRRVCLIDQVFHP